MAEVFAARSLGAGMREPIVIKRMHSHLASNQRFVAMFVDEARLCSKLDHPNIVRLHDFEATDQGLYLVLELVDGHDLRAVLKACVRRGMRLPAKLSAFVIAHVLEALDYAHGFGIVHRDLSPSNILVSRRGRIKLADFGIARAADRTLDRTANMLVGKFGYMSPEQARGLPLDNRSDLFSLGIVLAELLLSRRLFRARGDAAVLQMARDADLTNLNQHGWHISIAMRQIVERALARHADDRFQNAAEFRDALTAWLRAQSVRTGGHELAAFIREIGPL